MVTGHYELLISRVSSRSGDASSEFPTSHTFAHMCNANGALMSTDLRHVRVGEEYLYMRESLMFHVCGYWLSLLMGRALSYIQYIIHVYVLYIHSYTFLSRIYAEYIALAYIALQSGHGKYEAN